MKKIIYLFTLLILSSAVFAQAPQQISYQAVVRNSGNTLVSNTQVGVLLSITNANDSVFYSETQTPTTNSNGLISLAIGTGTVKVGSFTSIDWSKGGYFIKTQIDPAGGTSYTISGSSQLLSVPYALYAANGSAAGKNIGDMQYWDGSKWVTVAAGANGSNLTLCNGIPHWGACTLPNSIPTVITIAVSIPYNRTPGSEVGVVTSNGGSAITAKGFVWSKNQNPTLADHIDSATFNSVNLVDTFSTLLWDSFEYNTTYYFRAYATNSVGTAYGNQITMTTGSNPYVTTYSLGQSYGGGIIFYLDSLKQHGLIAALNDASGGVQWFNGGYISTNALDSSIGSGQANTTSIINVQSAGSYAASIASQTANGYSDWYLPSRKELGLMYTNLHVKGLGGFVGNYYWTSTEFNANQAWAQDFGQVNSQFSYWKNNQARVRAIRKF